KAVEVAERIRVTFAQLAEQEDGYPICATVSIGLVHCRERTLGVSDLLTQADPALYFAKERGRNRVEVTSSATMHAGRGIPSTEPAAAITAKSAALPFSHGASSRRSRLTNRFNLVH